MLVEYDTKILWYAGLLCSGLVEGFSLPKDLQQHYTRVYGTEFNVCVCVHIYIRTPHIYYIYICARYL